MDENRIVAAEERIAELLREVDDLSRIVARQADVLDRLERRVAMLAEREAAREAEAGAVLLADEVPPHY